MPASQMSRAELVALIAMMFATIAFSIDAMLPALPDIGRQLTPADVNKAQLVVTSFVLGMGLGTLFTGPLSDRFGRKPVILVSSILYCLSAAMAAVAQTLEVLLIARVIQGLGAAGPRVVALAIIRDQFSGREMARISSFVMIIFTLVPAVAPLIGAGLISLGGWPLIFVSFIAFTAAFCLWMQVRLPETLPVEQRRPFLARALWGAVREMLEHPVVRLSIAVQSLSFAMLFSTISSIQPIFDISFGKADSFPLWFCGIALASGTSSFLNAALVMRLGMQVLVSAMLVVQVGIAGVVLLAWGLGISGPAAFALFVFWMVSLFFQAGMTIGNLNAIAMEPMGHIAGMAASVIGSIATVIAVVLAVPAGLLFDGTPLPLACFILIEAVLALLLMQKMRRIEQPRVPA